MIEDPRRIGLKNGLSQLSIEELVRVLEYQEEFCLDTYNYDEEKQTFCPLAVGLNLHKKVKNPTHDKIFNILNDLGYKIYNTRGVLGEFYTNNRKNDLLEAAREVLEEKQKGCNG